MENIQELMEVISMYLTKSSDYFANGYSPNVLLQAINGAKLFAQRNHDFEPTKKTVTVPVLPDGRFAYLSDAIDATEGTAVKVKKFYNAFLTATDGSKYPLRIVTDKGMTDTERKMINLLLIPVGPATPILTVQSASVIAADPFVYRKGDKVWLSYSPTEGQTLTLDAYEWMKPYGVDDSVDNIVTTDWMLEFCHDYLLYRSMSQLNVFLKEDDRFAISQSKMTEAWNSLIAWDVNTTSGDENLD